MDLEHVQPVTQSSFIKVKQGSGDKLGYSGESQNRSWAFLSDKNNSCDTSVFFLFILYFSELLWCWWGK